MRCQDGQGWAQLSVATDPHTGRVESEWSDPRHPEQQLALHALFDQRRTSNGVHHEDARHTPVRAVSALLWSRGFEPAELVITEITVDTYRVEADGTLTALPMCGACRALLPEVTPSDTRPAPEIDLDHARAVITALDTPMDWWPRVPPARFAHGDTEDPATPPELRALFDAVETERGSSAMVRTRRPPQLSTEAALDAVLANPPAALWPGTTDRDGGGFLTWPKNTTAAELDEVDRATARDALAEIIDEDMAYTSTERVGSDRAEELADAITAYAGRDARWWINRPLRRWKRSAGQRGWQPLTSATFDAGVIAVDQHHVLIAWLMDED
ncbi:hypothetical protein [Actinomycetospora flava]|uniref:YwqJ-like deaminase n=1 Tax=Actinomycetospora flava TaxID=3129232 RepID=A0ABU8M9E1_9PSEU